MSIFILTFSSFQLKPETTFSIIKILLVSLKKNLDYIFLLYCIIVDVVEIYNHG